MLLGAPALVIAGLIAVGAAAAAIVGPRLHRRNPQQAGRPRVDTTHAGPDEARRQAGQGQPTGPGA